MGMYGDPYYRSYFKRKGFVRNR